MAHGGAFAGLAGGRALLLTLVCSTGAAQGVQGPPRLWTPFQREYELRELVDICTLAVGVAIDYEPGQLQSRVTMYPGRGLTTDQLWATVAEALAAKKLAVVQRPESAGLRVVALERAAELARLEREDLAGAQAAFLKVLIPVEHRDVDEVEEAVRAVLTQDAAVLTVLRDSNALLVADLAPNVRQAVEIAWLLDAPRAPPVIEEVRVWNTSPVTLAAHLERLTATTGEVSGENHDGKLLAQPESRSVLIVAPESELAEWRELVERFDRVEEAVTVEYRPRRFGLQETADLVERVVHAAGARSPSEPWSLVLDELTGTLTLTAPPGSQSDVRQLLDRLEATAEGERSPIRAFPIRNRQVSEMVELLQALLEAGALDQGAAAEGEGTERTDVSVRPGSETARYHPAGAASDVTITADEPTNRILAMGEARLLDQLGMLIAQLDVRQTHVLVEATVVVLSESQERDLGVELSHAGVSNGTLYRLSSVFGLDPTDATDTSIAPPTSSGFTGVVLNPGDFSAVVKALETVNDGRNLTTPKVLVNNNQEATLGSVVQTPFASTNASTTVATTSFGGTFDAGTTITVKPQVAEGDHLVLDYAVTLSTFVGEAASRNLPPPRRENQLQSVVTVPDGFSVIVGGLEIDTDTEVTSQVPVLGSIPLVGRLFQSTSNTETRNRFFVFLRCSVLRNAQFEDLRYLSAPEMAAAGVDDGWPVLQPRVIP